MRRKSTLSKREKEKSEQEKNRFKIIKKRENHYRAKQRKKMTDFVDGLTDAELRTKLAEYGFPVLPITTTTRKVMSKKLKMLIENKNKANSDGRRSLAKYSSEEESDDDSKKKNTNRRQTIAAVMLPPANKTRRSIRKNDTTLNDDLQDTPTVNTTTTTEVKTRRTTRIIKPVIEADLEEGSDSEPDPIESYLNSREIRPSPPRPSPPKMSYPISEPSTSSTLNRPYVSGRSPLGQSPDYGSPSRFATTTDIADSSFDKINQIRSRLSHSTNYEKPTFGSTVDKRATIGGYGDGDASSIIPPASTPYLSNFSKRLSQLSNSATAKPTDYSYKNDIIKEHDANGSSYSRSYLSSSD